MPKDVTKNDKKEKKEKKHFFKDFKAELKRVIWPTPKQLVNNTVAVIVIVLITAIIVFGLDFIFQGINHYGIEALKDVVDTRNEQTENTTLNQEEANEQEESNETTQNNETQNNTVNEE